MNNEVIISCAVTGSGDTAGKHPNLPITPKQIAEASIEAAMPIFMLESRTVSQAEILNIIKKQLIE